jgi:hypothetical protein
LNSYSVSFRTDDVYIKALNDLAEKTNRSKAEVLRDSLNLYIKAVDEWEQGRGIVFMSMEEEQPSEDYDYLYLTGQRERCIKEEP